MDLESVILHLRDSQKLSYSEDVATSSSSLFTFSEKCHSCLCRDPEHPMMDLFQGIYSFNVYILYLVIF